MNYVLIGLPGSGKSTIGVMLAKYLGLRFVDTDLVIQEQAGQRLGELLEAQGPEGFLLLENRILAELRCEDTVIATGGSAVYGTQAMQNFKRTGRCIYLRISLEEMRRRTASGFRRRGVVLREGQTLEMLYAERCALYERYADLTVDENGLSQEETLQKLLRSIEFSCSAGG